MFHLVPHLTVPTATLYMFFLKNPYISFKTEVDPYITNVALEELGVSSSPTALGFLVDTWRESGTFRCVHNLQ